MKINLNEKNSFFRLSDERSRVKFPEEEEKIVLFILRCKEIGIKLNSSLVIDEFCRICPKMIAYSKRSLRKWYYRFKIRYNNIINDCVIVKNEIE